MSKRDDLISKNRAVHGDSRTEHRGGVTPEYRSWQGMLDRCRNPRSHKYRIYGGRGISVCDEWSNNFPAFLSHIGRKPSRLHTLDRFPDKNGNYEPGNVRWATAQEQARNTRTCRTLIAFGLQLTLPEWAEKYDIPARMIHKRLSLGWDIESAISKPTETSDQRRERARAQAAASGNRVGVNAKR